MQTVWHWLAENKEWLFSGAGVALVLAGVRLLRRAYRRVSRAITSLPAPAGKETQSVAAAFNPSNYARGATLLSVHLELYKTIFVYATRVEVILHPEGACLFHDLISANPREDLSEFWLLLVASEVSKGRGLDDVVREHAALPMSELRLNVAQFVTRNVTMSPSDDAMEYIATFPPLARELARINSEIDARQGAAVEALESFLRSRERGGELASRVRDYEDRYGVERATVIATLAALGRAYEKHGESLPQAFASFASMPLEEFDRMIGICSRDGAA